MPQAIAQAFRDGQLGVMDYYNMRNVQSDTDMRNSIATTATPTISRFPDFAFRLRGKEGFLMNTWILLAILIGLAMLLLGQLRRERSKRLTALSEDIPTPTPLVATVLPAQPSVPCGEVVAEATSACVPGAENMTSEPRFPTQRTARTSLKGRWPSRRAKRARRTPAEQTAGAKVGAYVGDSGA